MPANCYQIRTLQIFPNCYGGIARGLLDAENRVSLVCVLCGLQRHQGSCLRRTLSEATLV
jgi:hypothetical protein